MLLSTDTIDYVMILYEYATGESHEHRTTQFALTSLARRNLVLYKTPSDSDASETNKSDNPV